MHLQYKSLLFYCFEPFSTNSWCITGTCRTRFKWLSNRPQIQVILSFLNISEPILIRWLIFLHSTSAWTQLLIIHSVTHSIYCSPLFVGKKSMKSVLLTHPGVTEGVVMTAAYGTKSSTFGNSHAGRNLWNCWKLNTKYSLPSKIQQSHENGVICHVLCRASCQTHFTQSPLMFLSLVECPLGF